MLRGILNIGREDSVIEGLTPVLPGITILGASSDHLLLDLTRTGKTMKLGDEIGLHHGGYRPPRDQGDYEAESQDSRDSMTIRPFSTL